jgi:hypothetical protein
LELGIDMHDLKAKSTFGRHAVGVALTKALILCSANSYAVKGGAGCIVFALNRQRQRVFSQPCGS